MNYFEPGENSPATSDSSSLYEGGGKGNINNMEKADSDVDELDFDNFKGIYFDEDPNRKYQDPETGCHFEYYDLCKRLAKLKQLRRKLDEQLGLPPDPNDTDFKPSVRKGHSQNPDMKRKRQPSDKSAVMQPSKIQVAQNQTQPAVNKNQSINISNKQTVEMQSKSFDLTTNSNQQQLQQVKKQEQRKQQQKQHASMNQQQHAQMMGKQQQNVQQQPPSQMNKQQLQNLKNLIHNQQQNQKVVQGAGLNIQQQNQSNPRAQSQFQIGAQGQIIQQPQVAIGSNGTLTVGVGGGSNKYNNQSTNKTRNEQIYQVAAADNRGKANTNVRPGNNAFNSNGGLAVQNYMTNDFKTQIGQRGPPSGQQRGQSTNQYMQGPNKQNLQLDQRSLSKDSYNRSKQQQNSNRNANLKRGQDNGGRKSQLSGVSAVSGSNNQTTSNINPNGTTYNQQRMRQQYNGQIIRDKRDRLLSGGPGGISTGQVGMSSIDQRNSQNNIQQFQNQNSQVPGSEKLKKNTRKLNSGIPAKILIGRQGPNVIIQGNHFIQPGQGYDQSTGVLDQQRKTLNNFPVKNKLIQQKQNMRKSQEEFSHQGSSQTQLQGGVNMRGAIKAQNNQMNTGGSRNNNPLNYLNNQQYPGTFNHLAIGRGPGNNMGPIPDITQMNFDSNSLDRVTAQQQHQQQILVNRKDRPQSKIQNSKPQVNPQMRQSMILQNQQNVYNDRDSQGNLMSHTSSKVNKRTSSLKNNQSKPGNMISGDLSGIQSSGVQAQNQRNNVFTNNQGATFSMYQGQPNPQQNYIQQYQSRQNTKESAESSKSRNGGLNDHSNGNSAQQQQINYLTGPAASKQNQAQMIQIQQRNNSHYNNPDQSQSQTLQTIGNARASHQNQNHAKYTMSAQKMQQQQKQMRKEMPDNQASRNQAQNRLMGASQNFIENNTVGAIPNKQNSFMINNQNTNPGLLSQQPGQKRTQSRDQFDGSMYAVQKTKQNPQQVMNNQRTSNSFNQKQAKGQGGYQQY